MAFTFRVRSVFISILSLILLISPILGLAKSSQAAALPAVEKAKKLFPNRPAKGSKVEIPEWRSARAKHYLKDDGTFEMVITRDSQSYRDPESKVWKDIDNTLVASDKKGFSYKNKANRFETQFPSETGTNSKIEFTIEGASMEMHPLGSDVSKGAPKGNKITYKNAFPKTDLEYMVQPDGLKEKIILQQADAPTTYRYEVTLNKLKYEVQKDGSVDFTYADSGNYAFTIPKPFMYENGDMPELSNQVTQTITQVGDKTYLEITADSTWIQATGRKFPVTIDPTIYSGKNFIKDTFASSTSTYSNSDLSGSDHVYAGTTASYGQTEAYVRFPLPGLPDGAVVTRSTIDVYNYLAKATATQIDVYPITNWWSATNTNWNNKPQRTSTPTISGSVATAGWQHFDITSLASDWYTGRLPNNGVAFVANPATAEGVGFTSTNYSDANYFPQVTVDYVIDPVGTNHFWTYTDDGVMPFKGNLLLSATDLNMPGRGVEASVNRSYNSRQITKEGVFGPGWLSNLDMRVWDLAGSVGFLDASGTVHLFNHNADDTYSPPAGVTLSLTRDDVNSLFKVTTTDNTVFYFSMNTGKIAKIADLNGNETTFTTETSTGDLLLTDPSGRSIRVHFRTDGKVDSAIDPKGRKAQYAYQANGLLQSVTISLGTESYTRSYAYSLVGSDAQNLLTGVTDPNGKTVTIGYDGYKRVTSVTRPLNGGTVANNYQYDTSVNPRKVTVTGTGTQGGQTVYTTTDNANVIQTDVKLNASETATTIYKWDATNWLYEIDAPNSQVTKVQYGENGLPIKITTPDGKDIRTNYDLNNNLISMKNLASEVSGANYDAKGNPVDQTDAVGNTIMQDYSTNGNLVNSTSAMSLSENYVYNSGFENVDTAKGGQPMGWNPTRALQTGEKFLADSTQKLGGFKVLHLSSNSTSGLYGQMAYRIPVTPKMTYNVSGDVRLGANAQAEFKLIWYNSAGTVLSEMPGLSLSKANSWGTEWHHKSTAVTASADAASVAIVVGVTGQGEAWIDNLMFEGGSGRSGSILVANQSFDNDLDHTGLADEWYKPDVNTTGISISYLEKKQGVASEKMIGDPSNYKYVIQRLDLGGQKGTKFNLSGWSMQTGVPQSGGTWGLQLELWYTDGTVGYLGVPFDRSQSAWQEVSRVMEAPKDFYKIGVKMAFDYMPSTATAWFDDVKVNVVNVPSSTISEYNYADNSSFEYDYDGSSWPDGWYRSSGNGTLTGKWLDLTQSNGNVYTGTHAIRMTNPSSWESATRTGDMIPYDSSKTYTAVGYMKTVGVTSSAVVLIHAYDANGNWLGEISSQLISQTTDWTRVRAVANSSNVPAGTAKLAIGVQMRAGNGTTYFDNIRFQEGEFRTQLGYDANGNYVTSVTNPLGKTVMLSPDPNTGNILSLQDALGNQMSYQYNLSNQITKFTFPYQGTSGATPVNKSFAYVYDKNGNLTQVTDPNAKTWTSFAYNELNQLKTYTENVTITGNTYPNTWDYRYNTSGRLEQVTLPMGQYAKMSYGQAGRVTATEFGKGTTPTKTFSYGYDLNGNLTSYGEAGKAGFTATYDNMNRVTKETEPNTANYLQNTYDDAGRRSQLSVHWGTNVWNYDYGFDNTGRAMTFHDAAYNKDARYLFNESGRISKVYYGNDTSTFYEYDAAGHVTQLRTEKSGETLTKLRFEYDANGNISRVWSDMDGSTTDYVYDSVGQLLQEKYANGDTIAYQYDEMGNRTAKIVTTGGTTSTTTYTYNPEKNRLLSAGSNNYQYEGNGNVINDGIYTYTWGDDNKLKQVTKISTGAVVASFTYDALGRRETMTTGTVTKTFHYDGDLVTYVEEVDSSTNRQKVYRFAYDHGGRPIFMSYAGKQYWYHYDQHGNVIRLTDNAGATVVQYKYDAWGNITNKADFATNEIANLNPYRYSGYWYDKETDKYYLKARYYDAQIGRFLAKDPVTVAVGNTHSLNAYNFAANNPVRFVDPSGLRPMEASDYETAGQQHESLQLYNNKRKYGMYNPGPSDTESYGALAGSTIAGSYLDDSAKGLNTRKSWVGPLTTTGTKNSSVNALIRQAGTWGAVGTTIGIGADILINLNDPDYELGDSIIDSVTTNFITLGIIAAANWYFVLPVGTGLAIALGVAVVYNYANSKGYSASKLYRRVF